MQPIERKLKAFDSLLFTVDLTEFGKTATDVEDIFWSVKNDLTSADDALLFKTYLTGGIAFTGTTILDVVVEWLETDYSNLAAGQEYEGGLFVKFTGDPEADEHVDETFKVKILQDFLRA